MDVTSVIFFLTLSYFRKRVNFLSLKAVKLVYITYLCICHISLCNIQYLILLIISKIQTITRHQESLRPLTPVSRLSSCVEHALAQEIGEASK